jgi:hypothetical protein
VSQATTVAGGESLTVHQLLQRLAPDYLRRFGAAMPGRHKQVLRKILACRTPALGGELFACPGCAHFHYRYHSCNDRHCPLCGQTDADQWLEQQRSRLLLPTTYFLVTFTVPEALRRLIRAHLRATLKLFFATSAQALQDLAANPKHLGAHLGMLAVLHTWSRTLIFHPHIHYLVPAGGLSLDQRQWRAARHKFLLPVKALGAHIRTLFKEQLQKKHPELYAQVPAQVWQRHWNVDCRPAGSGENALRYLARYVFKTATGNRTVSLQPDGKVRWPYRDNRTGQNKFIPLAPLDWMSRFLQHILPRHFARVRTFGWLHPAAKVRANRVRALLGEKPLLTAAQTATWQPPAEDPTVVPALNPPIHCKAPRCPRCHQHMLLIASWKAGRSAPLLPNRPP